MGGQPATVEAFGATRPSDGVVGLFLAFGQDCQLKFSFLAYFFGALAAPAEKSAL